MLERGTAGQVDTDSFAKQLLDRWGVVFRDILARGTLAPPWRDLLISYAAWKPAAKFAAADLSQASSANNSPALKPSTCYATSAAPGGAEEEIEIGLADPLNLTGIVLPGPRTSALAQGSLRLLDGVPQIAA